MSVFTRKSTFITNRDASPTVATVAAVVGGSAKEAYGWVTATNGDSASSYYPMFSVPSNARVSKIALQCGALGAGCTMDVGVFAPTQSPQSLVALGYANGATISQAFFASQVDVSAAVALTDVTNQSGTYTLDKQEMELWQALGLASDPNCFLDIACYVHVAVATTNKISLKGTYSF